MAKFRKLLVSPADVKDFEEFNEALTSRPFTVRGLLAVIFYALMLIFFIALLVIGILGLEDIFEKDLTYRKLIYSVCVALIFIGIVGILVSILAFIAFAYYERTLQTVLVSLLSILVILLLAFLIFLIVLAAKHKRFKENSVVTMFKAMERYQDAATSDKLYWDKLQQSFNCCGAINYTDWDEHNVYFSRHNARVPNSCCIPDANGNISPACNVTLPRDMNKAFYGRGCYQQLESYVYDKFPIVVAITTVAALLTIASLVVSVLILQDLKEDPEGPS